MLIVLRFNHIQKIRDKNRSHQRSSRGQKLYQKKIYLHRGSAPDPACGAYSAPQTPSWWGWDSQLPSKNPIPPRPFGPRLTRCPPSVKKILRAPMPPTAVSCHLAKTCLQLQLRVLLCGLRTAGRRNRMNQLLDIRARVPPGHGKSWTVMESRKTIFQAWKVVESSKGHGKSWKNHGK